MDTKYIIYSKMLNAIFGKLLTIFVIFFFSCSQYFVTFALILALSNSIF